MKSQIRLVIVLTCVCFSLACQRRGTKQIGAGGVKKKDAQASNAQQQQDSNSEGEASGSMQPETNRPQTSDLSSSGNNHHPDSASQHQSESNSNFYSQSHQEQEQQQQDNRCFDRLGQPNGQTRNQTQNRKLDCYDAHGGLIYEADQPEICLDELIGRYGKGKLLFPVQKLLPNLYRAARNQPRGQQEVWLVNQLKSGPCRGFVNTPY